MGKIVLSYRRDDARTITNWLYEKLVDRYGAETVFRDIDSIQPTENFKKRIGRALKDCDFVIAVIGPGWHGPLADGQSRISAANDWVRVEIETALQLDIPLLPVLVEDAEMPDPDRLPASLREMTEINALPISSGGARFYDDLNRLFATIESVAGIAARARPADAPLPGPTSPEAPGTSAAASPAPGRKPDVGPAPRSSPPAADEAPSAAPSMPANQPRSDTPSSPGQRPEGAWSLFEGRTLLALLIAPAIVMVLFWLWAFAAVLQTATPDVPPAAVFIVAALFMAGLGLVAKRKAKLGFPASLLLAAMVGLAVFVSVLAANHLDGEGVWIGLGVFVLGGAAATAGGFALASIKWGGRPPPP